MSVKATSTTIDEHQQSKWGKRVSTLRAGAANAKPLRSARNWDADDRRWVWAWAATTGILWAVTFPMVWFIHDWRPFAFNANDVATLEIFVSVFGLAYAVVVGLLIVEAHGRFHALSSAFRGEMNAIGDIDDCLGYFDDSDENKQAKCRIRRLLLDYTGTTKKYEWPLMERSREGSSQLKEFLEDKHSHPEDEQWKLYIPPSDKHAGWGMIDPFRGRGVRELIRAVRDLRSDSGGECCASQAVVDKICDLTTQRTERLELAENGLRGYLKFLLIFMSVVIFGGTLALTIAQFWLHLLMVWATIGGLVGLYMVLEDVDRPFSGFWRIDSALLDCAMDKLVTSDDGLLGEREKYGDQPSARTSKAAAGALVLSSVSVVVAAVFVLEDRLPGWTGTFGGVSFARPAAFALSVLFSAVAIVFGGMAIDRMRKQSRDAARLKGKWMAVAGIVFATIAAVACLTTALLSYLDISLFGLWPL